MSRLPLFPSGVLCPCCLRPLHSRDLKYVCPQCGHATAPGPLDLLLGRNPRCSHPGCSGVCTERVCALCGSSLPPDILSYEKYLRFSLLGLTGAGKTSFLTTMLGELRSCPDSPWVLSPMDAQTATLFQLNRDTLYQGHRRLDATPGGTAPPPLLWRIRDRSRMTDRSIPTWSLTIFDGAGEDSAHPDLLISRYIAGSGVLIVLIDPLSLDSVARRIDPDILAWSRTARHGPDASSDMVESLSDYIRQCCGIAPGRLIDRDVAVVFTKIDTVRSSFGSATVMQPSPHIRRRGFVQADADAVDLEIRDWLRRCGESAFLKAIETNFVPGRVQYFGVSSFGQPPVSADGLGRVMPHRILDPLLWTLSREGLIPTV